MGDPSDGEAPKAWHSRVRGKPSKVSSRRRNEFHGSRSKGVHKKSVREVRGGLSADEDDDDAAKEPMPDETAALVSSTNTLTTETFSEEELHLRQKCKRPSLLKGKQWTSVSSKIHSLKQRTPLHDGTTVRFVFQRPRTRIDWRSLHAVDVEQIFRETDIHKLESILETIAFGDVLGEDTRNFTEQNFLKLFRLSQLMIEYLLHVQETLASDKQKLLVAGESLQKRGEKLQVQCLWQYDALKRTRRELKHAKKTLNTYEMVLRTNGKVSSFQQVKSETTLMLQAELQHLRAASQCSPKLALRSRMLARASTGLQLAHSLFAMQKPSELAIDPCWPKLESTGKVQVAHAHSTRWLEANAQEEVTMEKKRWSKRNLSSIGEIWK
ncbi:hypothetical protein O6H91_02G124700 [Diphasiastrum complanatum]|uniref:Uncharacterized protein n=1 Tax=Diphasiastrum complanatum TaxID=34168 RepID=A0ACC2EKH7_DIPCM|nr:hypothetical protein O6H91_02G124700 [Diphasiastrum complanatum]